MLTITGARRVLGSDVLFTDLDLTVDSGRCAAIVGPNGSGKSTLLRCILDDDHLDAGYIDVAGMPPDDRSPRYRSLVSAETGDDATFFDVTVTEHLELLGAAHQVSSPNVGDVLDDAGLGSLGDRFPHALSTGQRQRFALAAAFFRPAQLLVLDEPERGLDSDGQDWVCDKICARKAAGTAVVIATHSPVITTRCADIVTELGR